MSTLNLYLGSYTTNLFPELFMHFYNTLILKGAHEIISAKIKYSVSSLVVVTVNLMNHLGDGTLGMPLWGLLYLVN